MRKRWSLRIVATLVLLSFVITGMSSTVDVLAAHLEEKRVFRQWLSDAGAGLVDMRDYYDKLAEDCVPEAVGYDKAVSSNHVERMYDEEGKSLNNIIFKNADGTRTEYIFDYPVKHRDKKGKIKDSSFEIADSKEKGVAFETAASAAVTKFSEDISDGISLEGNDTAITLVPHTPYQVEAMSLDDDTTDVNDEPERIDEETISYTYDESTSIEYSLTYTGFKEDIVVEEYTGQTEYDFTIYTNGLELSQIDGSYYLVDDAGEIKATIGDIIIFTADERNNTYGKMESQTIVEKEEYLITIVVDEDFLKDEKTVYPIRIDPTVEISYDNDGSGAIEDVTINSNAGSSGSSGSLMIGLREDKGISRILMKFPAWSDYKNLATSNEIISASVELRDIMCESDVLKMYCYVFAGNVWEEDTAKWSNVSPDSISTYLSGRTISYAQGVKQDPVHRYSFDITEAVKGWKRGNYDPNKGIIFRAAKATENGSTYLYKTFASFNRASYKPSLTITYDPDIPQLIGDGLYHLNNKYHGKFLRYTASGLGVKSGLADTLLNSIRFKIEKVTDGYVIRANGNDTKYLAVPSSTSDTSVTMVKVVDKKVPEEAIWTIMSAIGGGYLIKNNYNSRYLYTNGTSLNTAPTTGTSGTSTYHTRVWRTASNSTYATSKELESFKVKKMPLNIGDTKTSTITSKSPSSALWASATNFRYSTSDTSYVSIDNVTGKITGKKCGIATITATHKVTNLSKTFKVYVDRYVYELVNSYGFSESDALLIREFYDRVDKKFSGKEETYKAWVATRLLGGIVYNSRTYVKGQALNVLWDEVAGIVITKGNEKNYFTKELSYTENEYTHIKKIINDQYDKKGVKIDFAHMQIALAARLAKAVGENGLVSKSEVIFSKEEASYFGGWLGDAVLPNNNGTTSCKNDDYCADLDAENIYRMITDDKSFISCANSYYDKLTSSKNRADIFLSYIKYEDIKEPVFTYLVDISLGVDERVAASYGDLDMVYYIVSLYDDEQYHWDRIKENYPDTYNFLLSLKNREPSMKEY